MNVSHCLSRQDRFQFYQDIAIRSEYYISKYFIEYIELLHPIKMYKILTALGKIIYWEIKKWQNQGWYKDFKQRVNSRKIALYEGRPSIYHREFIASAQFQKLKALFPRIEQVQGDQKVKNLFDFGEGSCFGESLAAMRHHRNFSVDLGYIDLKNSGVKNEVIFFQALHFLKVEYIIARTLKKKLDAREVRVENLYSPDKKIDPARVFHYLRLSGASRECARRMSEEFPELLVLSVNELSQKIKLCTQMVRETAVPPQDALTFRLNTKKFSTKELIKNKIQQESDVKIRQFFCENTGCFALLCGGERFKGHAMFVKIEQGKCFTFDPAFDMCFTTPHTPDGVGATIDLMKKIVEEANLGGSIYYQVMSLERVR
jgi:hypothetical protein